MKLGGPILSANEICFLLHFASPFVSFENEKEFFLDALSSKKAGREYMSKNLGPERNSPVCEVTER